MDKSAERRSSIRKPIHHQAVMNVHDSLAVNCIIADVCLDGMFIKFMAGNTSRSLDLPEIHNSHEEVVLLFKDTQGKQFEIHAEVVHHFEGACGLHFTQRYDDAVHALVDSSIKSGQSIEHSLPTQTILKECSQFIHQHFGVLLSAMWAPLSEALSAAAVKASNDQQANTLMALAERIKQNRTQLQSHILHATEDPVAAFNQHLEKRKSMGDRLTIIDKHEFEDWLVSRVLVMRCETDYQALLLPLKLRLDALGVGDKRDHQSVFGPALLINAFHSVVQALIVDSATEKLIFKVFENQVTSNLTPLYEGLNAILIRHQILPKLSIKQSGLVKNIAQKRPQSKSTSTQSASSNVQGSSAANSASNTRHAHPAGENTGHESLSERTYIQPPFMGRMSEGDHGNFQQNQHIAKSALNNISSLLKSLRSDDVPLLTEQVTPQEAYSVEELDQGLQQLQINSAQEDWSDTPTSLMERVQANLTQNGQEKALDEDKKTAIDVVDRFFLSMRKNPRLSSEAKQLLFKLEVPVLKVLLKDDRFFEDQKSSVRAVMNRIAQLGATGNSFHPATREKITSLVSKIINEFEYDTAVFDSVLASLDELIARQNKLYVKNVERVAAAAEGSQKVEDAAVAVAKALNERIANKFVPSAVITLIEEGWKDYLNLIVLKQGVDCEDWGEALAVIDRLIAYGEDPRIPIDIKVILPKIQEGLKLVSGNNEASSKVRDALKAFIQNAPHGRHLQEQAEQLKVPETEDDLLSKNIQQSQALKDWILKVKSIPLGSWLRFSKDNGELSYMRLVWVAQGFSKFVFVNHQGMKVIELGLFKLSSYFKDGRIMVDADYEVPIVNQGLDDMVKDVYDKLAFEKSHDPITGLMNKGEFSRQIRLMMKKGKRTSACSLLYIHFRQSTNALEKLSDAFATKLVTELRRVSSEQAILARMSETDFAIFDITEEAQDFKIRAQEALLALCQQTEFAEDALLVLLSESRAHLGFNNPESMIKHTYDAIYDRFKGDQVAPSGSVERDSESDANEEEVHCDSDESTQGLIKEEITKEPVLETLSNIDVIIEDEAANASLDNQDFSELEFDIWGQDAQDIRSTSAGTTLEKENQINLFCVIPGDKETYFPETERCAQKLDQWWITTLVGFKHSQPDLLRDYTTLRVQLSALALNADTVVDELIGLAHRDQLDPKKVCFDIYDSYLLTDVDLVSMRMNRMKNMGYRFCLDNFGSDRTPFSMLKALPVDMIKIDDAFVRAMNQDDETADTATDSIVEIAHYLKKWVLATEVDSAVCLQRMKHLKVDFVQGSTIADIRKLTI